MLKNTNSMILLLFLFTVSCTSKSKFTDSSSKTGECSDDKVVHWQTGISKTFEKSCTGCHSAFQDHTVVLSSIKGIEASIQSGYMPPDNSLSASDKDKILKWVSCGGPK